LGPCMMGTIFGRRRGRVYLCVELQSVDEPTLDGPRASSGDGCLLHRRARTRCETSPGCFRVMCWAGPNTTYVGNQPVDKRIRTYVPTNVPRIPVLLIEIVEILKSVPRWYIIQPKRMVREIC
jgi:hypothetical protein